MAAGGRERVCGCARLARHAGLPVARWEGWSIEWGRKTDGEQIALSSHLTYSTLAPGDVLHSTLRYLFVWRLSQSTVLHLRQQLLTAGMGVAWQRLVSGVHTLRPRSHLYDGGHTTKATCVCTYTCTYDRMVNVCTSCDGRPGRGQRCARRGGRGGLRWARWSRSPRASAAAPRCGVPPAAFVDGSCVAWRCAIGALRRRRGSNTGGGRGGTPRGWCQ